MQFTHSQQDIECSFQFFLSSREGFLEDVGFVTFAFFNVVWATLYLESWKRRSAEISYQWGTIDQRDELLAEPRPLFKVRPTSRSKLIYAKCLLV